MNVIAIGELNLRTVLALWAAVRYYPEAKLGTIFFPKGDLRTCRIAEKDIFVGTQPLNPELAQRFQSIRGGRPFFSAAECILDGRASLLEREALEELLHFVDATHGRLSPAESLAPSAARRNRKLIDAGSLTAVLCALRMQFPHDKPIICSRMFDIFDGMLRVALQTRSWHQQAADVAKLQDGTVALSHRAVDSPVHRLLFAEFGVRAIVYKDGYNLGVLRCPKHHFDVRSPKVRKLIADCGEHLEWKYDEHTGHLFRGTPCARKLRDSQIDPDTLALAVAEFVGQHEHQQMADSCSE